MNIALQITANLTIILEPFLPFSMLKLREWLNTGPVTWVDAGRDDLLISGHEISKPGLLFEKIEDKEIERQIEKLQATKKANAVSSAKLLPAKDSVTFDDFSKIDIRTATILEAEKVPKTTKLLKLKIDTGIDVRTIDQVLQNILSLRKLSACRSPLLPILNPGK
jgi:methionyl-tRNA synthetase